MKSLLITFILALPLCIKAQLIDEKNLSGNGFIENKGQFIDQVSMPNEEVLYLLDGREINIQLRKTGFSYEIFDFQENDNQNELTISDDLSYGQPDPLVFQRFDIELLGMNSKVKVTGINKSVDYLNYHNGDGKNFTRVHSYTEVVYKDVYPGIDLQFVITNNIPKYNFIIHPEGSISDIQLYYKGSTSPFLSENGELVLNTFRGELKETIPLCYYLSASGKTEKVSGKYLELSMNTFGFEVEEKDLAGDLIIDPVPETVWGTYYGGSALDLIRCVKTDGDGNLIASGYTKSSGLASSGAFEDTLYDNQNNGLLVKFDSTGQRLWATYFNGAFELNALTILDDGEIATICETVKCTSNFGTLGSYLPNNPCTNGSYGGTAISTFHSDGTLKWATYYGPGNPGTGIKDIATMQGKSIVVVGVTNSTTGIATAGAHQSLYGQGMYDGFIACFDSTGNILWGTYYGGPGDERPQNVEVLSSGQITIVGGTDHSYNLSTPNSLKSKKDSIYQAFMARFSPSGNLVYGTYFGNKATATGFGQFTVDNHDNLYIYGGTDNLTFFKDQYTAYPTSNQICKQLGALSPGYTILVKLDTNGNMLWGTFLDSAGDASIRDMVYSTSLDAVLLTGDYQCICTSSNCYHAYQNKTNQVSYGFGINGSDHQALILGISASNGHFKFAPLIGGTNSDVFYSIAPGSSSNTIYYGGLSHSQWAGWSSPGAFQSTRFNSSADAILGLLNFKTCDTLTFPHNPMFLLDTLELCIGDSLRSIYYQEQRSYLQYERVAFTMEWLADTGLTIVNGQNTGVALVQFDSIGVFKLTLTATNGCGYNLDTLHAYIHVKPDLDSITLIPNDTVYICDGDFIQLTANHPGRASYLWNDNNTDSLRLIGEAGQYYVEVDNGSCSGYSDTLTVIKIPLPQPPVLTFDTINHRIISSFGGGIKWYRNDTLVPGNPSTPFTPTISGYYSATVTVNGCTSDTSQPIFFSPLSEEEFSAQRNSLVLYPNPAKEILYLYSNDHSEKIYSLQIMEAGGKIVLDHQAPARGLLAKELDVSKLAKGLYLIQVEMGKSKVVKRFYKD